MAVVSPHLKGGWRAVGVSVTFEPLCDQQFLFRKGFLIWFFIGGLVNGDGSDKRQWDGMKSTKTTSRILNRRVRIIQTQFMEGWTENFRIFSKENEFYLGFQFENFSKDFIPIPLQSTSKVWQIWFVCVFTGSNFNLRKEKKENSEFGLLSQILCWFPMLMCFLCCTGLWRCLRAASGKI